MQEVNAIKETYLRAIDVFGYDNIKADLIMKYGGLIHSIRQYQEQQLMTFELIDHIAEALIVTHLMTTSYKGFYVDIVSIINETNLDSSLLNSHFRKVMLDASKIITSQLSDLISNYMMVTMLQSFEHQLTQLAIMLGEVKFSESMTDALQNLDKWTNEGILNTIKNKKQHFNEMVQHHTPTT